MYDSPTVQVSRLLSQNAELQLLCQHKQQSLNDLTAELARKNAECGEYLAQVRILQDTITKLPEPAHNEELQRLAELGQEIERDWMIARSGPESKIVAFIPKQAFLSEGQVLPLG